MARHHIARIRRARLLPTTMRAMREPWAGLFQHARAGHVRRARHCAHQLTDLLDSQRAALTGYPGLVDAMLAALHEADGALADRDPRRCEDSLTRLSALLQQAHDAAGVAWRPSV